MAVTVEQKPMLAKLVRELPRGDLLYEPKWDGFRCLAFRRREDVDLRSRHGRPLARYFPEIVEGLRASTPQDVVLDGEILALRGGEFDFPALMARLHPAESRVRLLARETPALYVAFDLLELRGEDARGRRFAERRELLAGALREAAPPVFVTPATREEKLAQRWLEDFRGGGLDGVVAKPLDGPYAGGSRAMLKVKHERTAECVVAGARGSHDAPGVSALLLGLFGGDRRLRHIGVASSFSRAMRIELAHRLEPLATTLAGHPWEHGFLEEGGPTGRLPGAAGRWEPGMVLEWAPVRPELVAEVAYTQLDGYRLRHPAKLVRWRPDRDPHSCTLDQLDAPAAAPLQVLGSS